jgi:hypothetical protein
LPAPVVAPVPVPAAPAPAPVTPKPATSLPHLPTPKALAKKTSASQRLADLEAQI